MLMDWERCMLTWWKLPCGQASLLRSKSSGALFQRPMILSLVRFADELFLSLSTVKKHVHAILEKLDVSNRSQAAYYVSKRASF